MTRMSRTDTHKKYNNAKSRRHYEANRIAINDARRKKYAAMKESKGASRESKLPKQLTDEERRIRKAEVNRMYYEKNRDIIMAKRRAGTTRRRMFAPTNSKGAGNTHRKGVPSWQHALQLLSTEVMETLSGSTAQDYCRKITEACLSMSSREPLVVPSSVFGSFATKAHSIESSFWQDSDACRTHRTQISKVRADIRSITIMLENIECHAIIGIDDLREAYQEGKLDFQRK